MAGLDFPQMPRVQFESVLIKAILDYEAAQHANDADWSFRAHGFERIQDKLDLLLNKYNEHHTRMITLLCNRWGPSFLTSEQRVEIEQLPEDERPAFVADALGVVARARGMSAVVRKAGVSRESLNRALSADGNPEFATVLRVLQALDLRLSAAPLPQKKSA
jgi:probable addiction module antidote protein